MRKVARTEGPRACGAGSGSDVEEDEAGGGGSVFVTATQDVDGTPVPGPGPVAMLASMQQRAAAEIAAAEVALQGATSAGGGAAAGGGAGAAGQPAAARDAPTPPQQWTAAHEERFTAWRAGQARALEAKMLATETDGTPEDRNAVVKAAHAEYYAPAKVAIWRACVAENPALME
jgi:hypothetical protein